MTNSITFVPSLTEVNKDTDVIAADVVSMGTQGILYFVNEAIDNGTKGEIFVVDGSMQLAENVATVMNTQYTEEMKLMKDANIAKEDIEKVVATPSKRIKKTAKTSEEASSLRSNAETKKFLKEQAAKLANAKQSPLKNKSEGETTMTTETNATTTEATTKQATIIRRKKATTTASTTTASKTTKGETPMKTIAKETAQKEVTVKEKAASIKEKHAEKKVATGRRSSSTAPSKELSTKKAPVEAGKMGREKPQGETKFVKFEGPWYLNASRYEVLGRLEQIIEDRGDVVLGIEAITFSDHTEVAKYKNKRDLVAVEQFLTNGIVMDFPIKVNAGGDKVSSPSIGWVEYNGKRYPRFGFYRPNTLTVDFTCSCGTKNTGAGTANMYCSGCKKVWADINVTVDNEYGFEFDMTGSLDMNGNKKDGTPWLFQEIPNMKISEEVLVLALALAHFDQGLDMWDLVDFEDAE